MTHLNVTWRSDVRVWHLLCLCVFALDYDTGSLEKGKGTEGSGDDLSEDTDCDGSSLPEDSPEVRPSVIKLWISAILQQSNIVHKIWSNNKKKNLKAIVLTWNSTLIFMFLCLQTSRKVEWKEENVDAPLNDRWGRWKQFEQLS